MEIVRRMSPNRNLGRQGWQPDMIVCHITEGAFDGTVSWITNPTSQVSYHFVVARDGRIVQAVSIVQPLMFIVGGFSLLRRCLCPYQKNKCKMNCNITNL